MFNFDPDSIFMMSGWTLYLVIFLLPFVQEDAAVIGAATASLVGAGSIWLIFLTILAGLSLSDIWKYWIGWAARRYDWAQKFAEKPGVAGAGKLVQDDLIKTLFAARFVPGTRIPTYLACGFFKIPYIRFTVLVVGSAMLYVSIMFLMFHVVGEVAGERAKFFMPLIALVLIAGYILFRYMKHKMNRKIDG